MNLPDAATEMESDQPAGYARRIKSAAFFAQVAPEGNPVRVVLPSQSWVKLPPKPPACPFSVQSDGKTDAKNPQVN
jgi:hypothetical protein